MLDIERKFTGFINKHEGEIVAQNSLETGLWELEIQRSLEHRSRLLYSC